MKCGLAAHLYAQSREKFAVNCIRGMCVQMKARNSRDNFSVPSSSLCNRIIGPTGDVVLVMFIICQLTKRSVIRVRNILVDGICQSISERRKG